MYYFVEIACIVVEIIIANLFFQSLFKKKTKSIRAEIISFFCFGAVIALLSFIPDASVARIIFSVAGLFVIILVLFDSKVFPALFASLSFMTIYALTDVIVIISFSLFKIDSNQLFQYGNVRTLFIIISHIALLGIIVCISAVNKSKQGAISSYTLLLIMPSWFSSMVLCCMLVIQAYYSEQDFHPLYLAVALGLLYTNILIIYFVNRIREQEIMRHKAELLEHHYALEKAYYDQFISQQEQTKALWHDIKKYMRAMQSLVSKANSEEAERNFEQAQALFDEIHGVVDINNRAVNVILNEYMTAARNVGINLELDVQIPPELFVITSDLYVILGNTLDNSIDACSGLDEKDRYINLQLKIHNEILYYRIENPYPEGHLNIKRDGIHGYGLKNVERCAKKYRGTVHILPENGIFSVTVTLNNI